MGWLMVNNREIHSISAMEKFAKDLLRDPFLHVFGKATIHARLHRVGTTTVVFHRRLFDRIVGYGSEQALQLGASMVIWE